MAVIYIKFGHIGGKHSDPIYCKSRADAAKLAANLAFVHGGFTSDAANQSQWMLSNNTNRISWETADKAYYIEVVKQDKQ